MVIHHFNKLIRNKWVWGAFAVAISLVFMAPDDWFRGDGREQRSPASNPLPGLEYDADLRLVAEKLVATFPALQDSKKHDREHDVLKVYAALHLVREIGMRVDDAMLADSIRREFAGKEGFDLRQYEQFVTTRYRMDLAQFENLYRQYLTLRAGVATLCGLEAFAAPLEVERLARDYTDEITIQIARFKQDPAKADAIKMDNAKYAEWYGKNRESLKLPRLMKLNVVRLDFANTNLSAGITVAEEDIRKAYDEKVSDGDYTSSVTNIVASADTNSTAMVTNVAEVTKSFEEVRAELELPLRKQAFVERMRKELDGLLDGFYAKVGEDDERAIKEAESILPAAAAAFGVKPYESSWFPVDSGAVVPAGFSTPFRQQFWGVESPEELDSVRDLDPEEALSYRRFAVLASDRSSTVYLVECAATLAEHIPTLAESRTKTEARALRELRSETFKQEVAAELAKGFDQLPKEVEISTNITFSVNSLGEGVVPDMRIVVPAAMKLDAGEVSDVLELGATQALAVKCISRKRGDIASTIAGESQARREIMALQTNPAVIDRWLEENLRSAGWTDREHSDREEDQ